MLIRLRCRYGRPLFPCFLWGDIRVKEWGVSSTGIRINYILMYMPIMIRLRVLWISITICFAPNTMWTSMTLHSQSPESYMDGNSKRHIILWLWNYSRSFININIYFAHVVLVCLCIHRYAGDIYAGGNPWVLLTAALSQLLYRAGRSCKELNVYLN